MRQAMEEDIDVQRTQSNKWKVTVHEVSGLCGVFIIIMLKSCLVHVETFPTFNSIPS